MRLLALLALLAAPALADDRGGQREFRDIFFSYLERDARIHDPNARKLLYALPQELHSPPREAFAGPPLQALDALYKKWRPTQLYELGVKAPFHRIENPEAAFQRSGPVTIVIVPGIFGEFIAHFPFEEILKNKGSAFARQFQAAWARARPADKTDAVFSMADVKHVERPLPQIIEVASIDDSHGRPLVKLVFLKPLFASLETLGKLSENTEVYLRRLGKFWNVVGAQRFYLLGYSRGAAVALDLAVAARARAPWGKKLAGVISHAGVVYGTPLADASLTPGDPSAQLLAVVTELAAKLNSVPADFPEKPGMRDELRLLRLIEQNWVAWAKAGYRIARIQLHAAKPDPGVALEQIRVSAPGVRSTAHFIKEFAWEHYKLLRRPRITGLEKSEHFKNVQRFKTMVAKMTDGVGALTTRARLDWWRTHTLPAGISLYAIGGTMADAARPERANRPLFDGRGVSLLAKDPMTTFVDSLDFQSLRGSYYQMVAAAGGEVNDSQVPLQRIRFWTRLNKRLNPRGPDLPAYYLGTLGQDHWGLAFPVAVEQHNHKANPFPRVALMKAIATFIARHP